MLGDAAGNIAPLCGNGMSMAMHASKLAFEQSLRFLSQEISRSQLEENYSKNWNHHFAQRISVGALLQHTFGRELLTNFTIGLCRKLPKLTTRLIELTHGQSF
jgi:flavin-dependent dehydrogenase